MSRSLFTQTKAEKRSWQSYAASVAVHALAVLGLLLVTVPAIEKVVPRTEKIALLTPPLPRWRPQVLPRPAVPKRIGFNQPAVVLPKPSLPDLPASVVKFSPQPTSVAKAPELQPVALTAQPLPEVNPALPVPPKPDVRTGAFGGLEPSKEQRTSQAVRTGGFDSGGAGNSAGAGRATASGVTTGGFGSAGEPTGVPGGTGRYRTVLTGGFGDGAAAQRPQGGSAQAIAPATTPVEILYKPKPLYSSEARSLRVEGQVALNVVFAADGSIKVLKVVRGLGHGLDEAAQQAALQVRFKPATRDGVPVDTNATLYITFQLT